MIGVFNGEYRFLSNFYPCKVWLDGIEYPSVEHAYQAAKTESREEREVVRQCKTAGDAKRAGRRVTLKYGWDSDRNSYMKNLLQQKFSDKNPELVIALLQTGTQKLCEGNTWGDRYWGVDSRRGGENWLGKLLMEVRDSLLKDRFK